MIVTVHKRYFQIKTILRFGIKRLNDDSKTLPQVQIFILICFIHNVINLGKKTFKLSLIALDKITK